jgi:hypothetical protein
VLRDPWIHYSAKHMPNLHGLAENLGLGMGWEMGVAGVLLGGLGWVAWRGVGVEEQMAMALVGGLLVSYHSGIADEIVLYPVYLMVRGKARGWMTLMLTPAPFVMVMVGPPWSMAMAVLLMGLFVMIGWEGVSGKKMV